MTNLSLHVDDVIKLGHVLFYLVLGNDHVCYRASDMCSILLFVYGVIAPRKLQTSPMEAVADPLYKIPAV